MKKILTLAAAVCAVALFAAEKTETVILVPEGKPVYKHNPDAMQPMDNWTIFNLCFLQNVPAATGNSNVFGIKTGWPASGGIGRCFGLEASWLLAGTDCVNGVQACWIVVKNREMCGLQASLVTAINKEHFLGVQATGPYAYAGDFHGGQFALVSQAKNYKGIQGGLALALAENVRGFQAGAVSIATGRFDGVQCGIYNQIGDESSALQLGLINFAGGKGMQFGLLNFNPDAWIPVFPIVNFSF